MRSMMLQSHLKISLLSFILLLSSSQILATDVHYCEMEVDYAVKVDGVKISPNPVVRGKLATFNISAATGEAFSGGKIIIDVSYFGVHVHTETHGLCEQAACPVASGDFVLSHAQKLPSFAPPGSYSLKMTMEDEKNKELTCITFKFKIGLGSSGSDEI